MTLLWSPESIHDLLALRAHIAEHDPAAAKRVALHILYCGSSVVHPGNAG
jgi:plasmid stabilization system protein ParE